MSLRPESDSETEEPLLPPTLSSLARLENHVKQKPFPGRYVDVLTWLAAFLTVWLYIRPNWEIGIENGGVPSSLPFNLGGLPMAIIQLVGGIAGAVIVGRNVADVYARQFRQAQDALKYSGGASTTREDEGVISQYAWRERVAQSQNTVQKLGIYFFTFLLAFLTAIPLGSAAAQYRDFNGEPLGLLWLKVFITVFAYTAAHTRPMLMITETIVHRRSRAQENETQKLREHLVQALATLQNRLRQEAFVRRGPTSYHVNQTALNYTALSDLLGAFPANASLPANTRNPLKLLASETFGLLGAIVSILSISGYLQSTWNIFLQLSSTIPSIFMMAAVLIPTILLLSVYGRKFGQGVFALSTSLLSGTFEAPFSYKLYPALYIPILTLFVFIDIFGYGTALKLVQDNCRINHPLCQTLEWMATIGIPVYGMPNMLLFMHNILIPMLMKCVGSQDKKELLARLEEIERMQGVFYHLSDEETIALLRGTPSDLLLLLGIEGIPAQTEGEASSFRIKPPESHRSSSMYRSSAPVAAGGP